jgi:Lipase C-terminal domain/Lipase (class 2)
MSCACLGKAGTLRFAVSALAGTVLALLAVLVLSVAPAAADDAVFKQRPILFVHGIEGSGAQFESQKMRFMSNGYPERWIDEVDYNSTRAVGDKSEVDQQIDQAIAALKQRTGKARVDVVAHSLGTSVMYDYLTNGDQAAQRRANIGRYINVDGQDQNPGVPTLAVWAGRGTPGRSMAGAKNVTIPNQTHVQTCTSKESFVEYYKFLTGHRPENDIVPQTGAIQVAGKALDFPENSGAAGSTIQIWPLNLNGQRTTGTPRASLPITDGSTGGGAWGPVTIQAGVRYEFTFVSPGLPTLHIYYEPFVRSDYTVRLLQSAAIEHYVGDRPGSASGVMIRYKELWGDQGAQSDKVFINGLNVCTPTLCPISKQVNAFFAFDRNRDGQTDLSSPDPVLNGLPFITGADVFMRGSTPPDGTITFKLISRGAGPVRTLKIPNWEATADGFTIQWNDFE